MKYRIILILFLVSVSAIHDRDHIIMIIENAREQNGNGYNFRYSTSDGQERQETGRMEKVGENLILRMSGSYSYISSDGNKIAVVYEADENGYKPNVHFKSSTRTSLPSTRTSLINEGTIEKGSKMIEILSTEKPVTTTTSSGPVFNLTENMEEFSISSPFVFVQQIGSAAIASLAGGGLG